MGISCEFLWELKFHSHGKPAGWRLLDKGGGYLYDIFIHDANIDESLSSDHKNIYIERYCDA